MRDRDLDLLIEPVDHAPSVRTRRGKLSQAGKRVRHPRRSPPGDVVLPHGADDVVAPHRRYRWEGDTAFVWPTIDLGPEDEPDPESIDRLDPDADGHYDLGAVGWVFVEA